MQIRFTVTGPESGGHVALHRRSLGGWRKVSLSAHCVIFQIQSPLGQLHGPNGTVRAEELSVNHGLCVEDE